MAESNEINRAEKDLVKPWLESVSEGPEALDIGTSLVDFFAEVRGSQLVKVGPTLASLAPKVEKLAGSAGVAFGAYQIVHSGLSQTDPTKVEMTVFKTTVGVETGLVVGWGVTQLAELTLVALALPELAALGAVASIGVAGAVAYGAFVGSKTGEYAFDTVTSADYTNTKSALLTALLSPFESEPYSYGNYYDPLTNTRESSGSSTDANGNITFFDDKIGGAYGFPDSWYDFRSQTTFANGDFSFTEQKANLDGSGLYATYVKSGGSITSYYSSGGNGSGSIEYFQSLSDGSSSAYEETFSGGSAEQVGWSIASDGSVTSEDYTWLSDGSSEVKRTTTYANGYIRAVDNKTNADGTTDDMTAFKYADGTISSSETIVSSSSTEGFGYFQSVDGSVSTSYGIRYKDGSYYSIDVTNRSDGAIYRIETFENTVGDVTSKSYSKDSTKTVYGSIVINADGSRDDKDSTDYNDGSSASSEYFSDSSGTENISEFKYSNGVTAYSDIKYNLNGTLSYQEQYNDTRSFDGSISASVVINNADGSSETVNWSSNTDGSSMFSDKKLNADGSSDLLRKQILSDGTYIETDIAKEVDTGSSSTTKSFTYYTNGGTQLEIDTIYSDGSTDDVSIFTDGITGVSTYIEQIDNADGTVERIVSVQQADGEIQFSDTNKIADNLIDITNIDILGDGSISALETLADGSGNSSYQVNLGVSANGNQQHNQSKNITNEDGSKEYIDDILNPDGSTYYQHDIYDKPDGSYEYESSSTYANGTSNSLDNKKVKNSDGSYEVTITEADINGSTSYDDQHINVDGSWVDTRVVTGAAGDGGYSLDDTAEYHSQYTINADGSTETTSTGAFQNGNTQFQDQKAFVNGSYDNLFRTTFSDGTVTENDSKYVINADGSWQQLLVFLLNGKVTGPWTEYVTGNPDGSAYAIGYSADGSIGDASSWDANGNMNEFSIINADGADETLVGTGSANALDAVSFDDTLVGGNGDNVLVAGTGNVTLIGGSGNNTYRFGADFGTDTISNISTSGNGTANQIIFEYGISQSNLSFTQSGYDLEISDGTGTITVKNQFLNQGNAAKVNTIRFIDGTTLTAADIVELVGPQVAAKIYADTYDVNGVKIGDTWIATDDTSGSDTLNADGSSSGVSYDANGVVTSRLYQDASGNQITYQYAADGMLASDTWTHVDGSTGSDTYANGGSSGGTHALDGSSSSYALDANSTGTRTYTNADGSVTTYDYTAGALTGDTWTHADGSTGSDTYANGGSSGGTHALDGSSSSYALDATNSGTRTYAGADGGVITYDYTAGTLTGDTWTHVDGSTGSDTYANGGSSGGTHALDGSSSSYALNASSTGTRTYTNADSSFITYAYTAGTLTGDTWKHADGSTGSDTYANGGSSGSSLALDGSSSSYALNASSTGTRTYTNADSSFITYAYTAGALTGDTWKHADGSTGGDTYANGGSSGSTHALDGSSSSYALDATNSGTRTYAGADGGVITYDYTAGTLTGDTWKHADGSTGGDTYANGGSVSTTLQSDGSSSVHISDANGDSHALYASAPSATLTVGSTADVFAFARGSGSDQLYESIAAGSADQIRYAPDIAANQLWFEHSGNNLVIDIIGTSDSETIVNWYSGAPNQVGQFDAGDGTVLLASQVDNLVSAMAAFAPPSAGQTSLSADYQSALAPVLAANWH